MNLEPEFSRPFVVDRLGANPVTQPIFASAKECAALARRFGIVALDGLSASLKLERVPGSSVRVSGRLEADVTQTCVLSLVDFASHVEESFSTDFGDAPALAGTEIDVDFDIDPPEPIEGGVIDLGELVAQYLSLALDPHPRAPGAALDAEWTGDEDAARSPFAVLKKLKKTN
jgi:uncharacterized metal-binding protein YceD (DUF177 family)